MRLRFLMAASAMLVFTLAAHASKFQLISSTNGTFTYGLNQTSTPGLYFSSGSSIALTGLDGITSAKLVDFAVGEFDISYTPTSVLLSYDSVYGSVGYPDCPGFTCDFDLFTVTSTATGLGPVAFSVNGTLVYSGTVNGPVTGIPVATPEPSSLALLGTGVLGVIGAAKRRFA